MQAGVQSKYHHILWAFSGSHLAGSFKDENYGWTVQMTFTLHNLYNEQMQTLIPPRK